MIEQQCTSYPVSIFMAGSAWEAETVCQEYCDALTGISAALLMLAVWEVYGAFGL